MTPAARAALCNQKINNKKNHSRVPTQAYNYKKKTENKTITYQWVNTSYY